MADETKTLATIGIEADGTASVREPIFVNLSSYKNSRYLDLRKFYQKDGQWLPSSKGITLHAEQFNALLKILGDNQTEILEWIK
jgi:hypothetical protein